MSIEKVRAYFEGFGIAGRIRVVRRQADHCGIFAVDDCEMDALALIEAPQAAAQVLHAARAHHVAHREDVVDHSSFSSVSVS